MQKSCLNVLSVEVVEEEIDVFDIEVEVDHSFLAHGAVLHNCPSCGALDGHTWVWGEDHPVPSLHWGCRCGLIPATKTWEQMAREAHGNSTLAKELDGMDEGSRASLGGQVSGSLTYQDWFDAQKPARQLEILGPRRLALYQSKHLSFEQMLDQRGNELTLDQLKALA